MALLEFTRYGDDWVAYDRTRPIAAAGTSIPTAATALLERADVFDARAHCCSKADRILSHEALTRLAALI